MESKRLILSLKDQPAGVNGLLVQRFDLDLHCFSVQSAANALRIPESED
jgi:hypothetical protein